MAYLDRAFDTAALAGSYAGLVRDNNGPEATTPDPENLAKVAELVAETARWATLAEQKGDADAMYAVGAALDALRYINAFRTHDSATVKDARISFFEVIV